MSKILKGLNEAGFNRYSNRDITKSQAYQADGGANDEGWDQPQRSYQSRSSYQAPPAATGNGMYFYTVLPGHESRALAHGLKQTKSGKWFSKQQNKVADTVFGPGRYWAPKNQNIEEGEVDYGPEWDEKVARLGQMAKQGERKTVWDPVKRVYKTVPVNPPKEQGVAEGSIKDAEQALARHGQRKVDHEEKYGPMSGADLHQHEVMRKQLLDKKRRAQAAYTKKQGVAEGYDENYYAMRDSYHALSNKVDQFLIKAYDKFNTRDQIIDAAKTASQKAAAQLGIDPNGGHFKEIWINALARHDVDTNFGDNDDNDDNFDYTDYSMRKGEQGVAEGILNKIANKVMGAAPEQPKYKVGQRVKYETSPHQPDWADGGRGVGVITDYKNGHYMINGNPVNHFEIKGVVGQGVAEGSREQVDPNTVWEVSFDYGPHQSDKVKVRASSQEDAEQKGMRAAKKLGHRFPQLNWAMPAEQDIEEEKQRLDPKCWTGYKKQGTKMKGDTRVNNCVPVSESSIMQGLKKV